MYIVGILWMFDGTLYIDTMAGFVGTCIRNLTLLQGSRNGNTELDWENRLLPLEFFGSWKESGWCILGNFELWIWKWLLKTSPFWKLMILTWLDCPGRIFFGRLYSDDPLYSSTKGQEEEGKGWWLWWGGGCKWISWRLYYGQIIVTENGF